MTEGGAYALSPDCRTRPHRSRRWVQAPYAIPRAPQPPTYGLRVRTIGSSAAVSILPADIAVTAGRNSSFRLSATANDDPDDAAICGFHTGCGLIIRRLKKEWPKKGPHKVPSKQADVLHGTDALTPSAPPQGLAPARSRTTRSSWDRCGGSDEPARFAGAQCCASGRQGVASPRPR